MSNESKVQTGSVRQTLFRILKFVISFGLIGFLLYRIGLDKIFVQIATANPRWIAASVLIFMFSNVLGSVQWYMLLRSKQVQVTLWQVIKYYHVGLFFNNFLIGYVGGDAFRIYDISKLSGDTNNALSTVFFDRFVGFFALTTLALLVTLVWLQRLTSQITVLTIALVFLFWIFGFYLLFRENAAKRLAVLFKPWLPEIIATRIRDIYYALNGFRHNKIMLLEIFLLAISVQSCRILTHLFAARAVNVDIQFYYFFIFIPIVALAASLPISLGGIGVREQSAVTLFAQVGVNTGRVVAFEFIAYLVGIVATLPGGIIFALRREQQKPKLE